MGKAWTRKSALLEPGDFPFKTTDFLLRPFNLVERTTEPAHPASQTLLFGFQFGPASGQELLASAVFGKRCRLPE
jgi:hypothetical protein